MTDYFSGGALKEKMEKAVIQSACYGLVTYEEKMTDEQYEQYLIEEDRRHLEWKARRKEGYRRDYYRSLGEEGMRQRNIEKTRKILNDLRQKWFKARCSGQCMDFNCIKCEEIRKPLKQELDQKQMELTNLEMPV